MNTSGSSEAGSASYLLPSVWLKVVAGKGFFLVLLAPLRSQGLYLQATQTGIKGIGQSVPTKTLDFGSKNLGRFPLGCCCHANLAWVVVPSFLLFAQAVRRMDRTHHSGQYRRGKRAAIRRTATNSCMKLNTMALTVWPDGEAPGYFSN